MGSAEFLDRMWRPPTSIPTIPTQRWPTAAPVHIWSGQEHVAAGGPGFRCSSRFVTLSGTNLVNVLLFNPLF